MIIDCHIHCGELDDSDPQTYEDIASKLKEADIDAAVCFSPVNEIYDRYSPNFREDNEWQERRNHSRNYLCSLKHKDIPIYPFHFVWNDFDTSSLSQFCGIKWHRHEGEPEYHYEDINCKKMISAIREHEFVILLEETYENTLRMVNEIAKDIPFIIPHLGFFNGGTHRYLELDFWKRENIYADMSVGASRKELKLFIDKFGPHKLLFGSDYPFCTPLACKEMILDLNLPKADEDLIFCGNIKRLLKNTE